MAAALTHPYTDDNAREEIAAQVQDHCPSESPKHLTNDEWHRQFASPWSLINRSHFLNTHKRKQDGGHDAIYCRLCLSVKKHGRILANRLFVSYEQELSEYTNAAVLVKLVCHNCDFEMLVPLKHERDPRKDHSAAEEAKKLSRYRK